MIQDAGGRASRNRRRAGVALTPRKRWRCGLARHEGGSRSDAGAGSKSRVLTQRRKGAERMENGAKRILSQSLRRLREGDCFNAGLQPGIELSAAHGHYVIPAQAGTQSYVSVLTMSVHAGYG